MSAVVLIYFRRKLSPVLIVFILYLVLSKSQEFCIYLRRCINKMKKKRKTLLKMNYNLTLVENNTTLCDEYHNNNK